MSADGGAGRDLVVRVEFAGPLKNGEGLSVLYDEPFSLLGGINREGVRCDAIGIDAARLRKIRDGLPGDGPVAQAIEALGRFEALTCAACGASVDGLDAAGGMVVTHPHGEDRLFATVACRICAPRWARPSVGAFRVMNACSAVAIVPMGGGGPENTP